MTKSLADIYCDLNCRISQQKWREKSWNVNSFQARQFNAIFIHKAMVEPTNQYSMSFNPIIMHGIKLSDNTFYLILLMYIWFRCFWYSQFAPSFFRLWHANWHEFCLNFANEKQFFFLVLFCFSLFAWSINIKRMIIYQKINCNSSVLCSFHAL